MITPLTLIAMAVLGYALLSGRLASTVVTAPIFFAAIGLIAGPVLGAVNLGTHDEILITLLESALVMVLFADASSLDIRSWTRERALSERLLGIGLPLTMVAGAVVALALFPGMPLWEAALVGAMLAPTDAALGQAVVANPRVPAVIRNALNVESGLNDGLALPFVTIFLAIGQVASGQEAELHGVETLVRALGGSTLIGLALGLGGGWLIRTVAERRLGDKRWLPIALVALAVATFSIAEQIDGSGFLAVWVAGLCAGFMVRDHVPDEAFHLPEQLADVLAAVGFLLLGAALLEPVVARATPQIVLYALLSLTVVRILPVAVAMLRTGFAPASVLYIGWFGPRGLASIVFAGVVVGARIPDSASVTDVVLLTVAFSLVLHGMTAAWGARIYAAWFARTAEGNPGMPEAAELTADGMRGRRSRLSSPDGPSAGASAG
jgi:NhaP-type Na+/H+ or K+/H+ antiporter